MTGEMKRSSHAAGEGFRHRFCRARWWVFAARRLMESEVESLTAPRGERPGAVNHRIGYRDRSGRPAPAQLSCACRSSAKACIPGISGTSAHGRAGARCGDPRSLCPGCRDALDRRAGEGDGDEGHFREPEPAPAKAGVSDCASCVYTTPWGAIYGSVEFGQRWFAQA
jgi:hypothetical protein